MHKHDSNQEGTCLICHATERANVVAIDVDAGKPYISSSDDVSPSLHPVLILDAPKSPRIPRAPPSIL